MAKSKTPKSGPPVSPLADYMDELVRRMEELVPSALTDFDVTAVHQSRVATRRMKAALGLLAPVLPESHFKAFGQLGKRLRRRLGPLRDLDVMLDHLDVIEKKSALVPAAQWLRARLTDERLKARAKSAEGADPAKLLAKLGAWWTLRSDVVLVASRVPTMLAVSVQEQLTAFSSLAGQLAESAKQNSAHTLDPHELRIAGKALRYTLEMAEAEGRKLPGVVRRSFKSMQDSLGLWHDYVVLGETALRRALDELLAHRDPNLAKAVLLLAREMVLQSERQLKLFNTLWAEKGNRIREAVVASVEDPASKMPGGVNENASAEPLGEVPVTDFNAIQSETDLDPSDSGSGPASEEPLRDGRAGE